MIRLRGRPASAVQVGGAVCVAMLTGIAALVAGPSFGAARSASLSFGQPPTSSASEFRPSLHGFKFVNSFTGSPLPRSLRGVGESLNVKTPGTFGLCGGMSAAAADFFLAGVPVPSLSKPPRDGALHDYIFDRQADSLGPGYALATKFAAWMMLDDESPDGTRRRTLDEFGGIRGRLSAGELCTIGLVFGRVASTPGGKSAGGPDLLWENHQVLAYGVEPVAATDAETGARHAPTWRIRIYDPNYPGRDDVVIRASLCRVRSRSIPLAMGLMLERPTLGLSGSREVPGQRSTRVRGFFAMPYERAMPPASLIGLPGGNAARPR